MQAVRVAGMAVLVVATVVLSGCAGSVFDPARGHCAPRIRIEPQTAAPGTSIVLTSGDVCEVAQPSGGWVVTAGHVGDGDVAHARAITNERFDGSFRVELELAADFPRGAAWAGVDNWDYSWCTGTAASCAGVSGDFVVE